ncbi:MAG: hypothetical protein ACLRSE_02100 [Alistipes finegoldii]
MTITVLEGSWILFDRVSLEGPAGTNVEQPQQPLHPQHRGRSL